MRVAREFCPTKLDVLITQPPVGAVIPNRPRLNATLPDVGPCLALNCPMLMDMAIMPLCHRHP